MAAFFHVFDKLISRDKYDNFITGKQQIMQMKYNIFQFDSILLLWFVRSYTEKYILDSVFGVYGLYFVDLQ